MKDNLTEIIVVRSDAAGDNAEEANGKKAPITTTITTKAAKHFFESIKKDGEDLRVTLAVYGDKPRLLAENVPLDKLRLGTVAPSVTGAYPIIDTVADVIDSTGKRYAYTPEEERPSNIIFIISALVQDNASRKHTYDQLKKIIAHQRDVYQWQFFLHTSAELSIKRTGIDPEFTTFTDLLEFSASEGRESFIKLVAEKRK